MSFKIKIITSVVAIVAIVASIVSIYMYINHLNNTVNEMSVTIANQLNEINSLKSNVDSLNKKVSSLSSVIAITDDYIKSTNQAKKNEASVKQAIYEQVISNEEVKSWFNELLPNDVLTTVNSDAALGVCENSN